MCGFGGLSSRLNPQDTLIEFEVDSLGIQKRAFSFCKQQGERFDTTHTQAHVPYGFSQKVPQNPLK